MLVGVSSDVKFSLLKGKKKKNSERIDCLVIEHQLAIQRPNEKELDHQGTCIQEAKVEKGKKKKDVEKRTKYPPRLPLFSNSQIPILTPPILY